jgi:hypothetical protein
MPKTTSKNWAAWNVEELDRRHKEGAQERQTAELEKRALRKWRKKKAKGTSSHLKHKLSQNSPAATAAGKEKRIAMSTCRSLAAELRAYWPRYLLQLAQKKGANLTSTTKPIPTRIVNEIRAELNKLPIDHQPQK